MIRVGVVDDHAIVRRGLVALLGADGELEVVGTAGDGDAALQLCLDQHPDVVLMDLSMPGIDGVEATRRIVQQAPGVQVVVLTSFVDRERVVDALRAGAIGYLLKDAPGEEIVRAIRDASRGQPRLHATVTRRLMEQVAAPAPPPVEAPPSPAAGLTSRELEVLRLIAEGMSNKEIARALGTSDRTVKSHVSNVLSKLGVLDRTQAALFAIRAGLVSEDA
jgi:DNA-binding NarL/FixJ family response regulator